MEAPLFTVENGTTALGIPQGSSQRGSEGPEGPAAVSIGRPASPPPRQTPGAAAILARPTYSQTQTVALTVLRIGSTVHLECDGKKMLLGAAERRLEVYLLQHFDDGDQLVLDVSFRTDPPAPHHDEPFGQIYVDSATEEDSSWPVCMTMAVREYLTWVLAGLLSEEVPS